MRYVLFISSKIVVFKGLPNAVHIINPILIRDLCEYYWVNM